MVVYQLMVGLTYFLRIVELALLAYCILSWFMPHDAKVMRLLGKVVEPLIWPARRLIARFTQNPIIMSLAPLVVMLLLNVVSAILLRIGRMFL